MTPYRDRQQMGLYDSDPKVRDKAEKELAKAEKDADKSDNK